MKTFKAVSLFCLALLLHTNVSAQSGDDTQIIIEDFESYNEGKTPERWKIAHKKSRSIIDLPDQLERDRDYVEVLSEGRNKVLKVYAADESEQIVLLNGSAFEWDVQTHPTLSWKWKALQLPAGAREDDSSKNDSGGALYVTFNSKDWLGRPRTIKYVYSSSLPRESIAKYGVLRVIVASSGTEGINNWIEVKRNVLEDYRKVFGKYPSDQPGYLMVWSDSDNTNDVAEIYFDDIVIGQ